MRSIDLSTADGLPPLPMHLSWVRDGILVVGMDNEVHVYSQWRGAGEGIDIATTDAPDTRTLTEQSLHTVSSSASLNLGVPKGLKVSMSTSSIKLTGSFSSISMLNENVKRNESQKKLGGLRGDKGEFSKSDSVSSMQIIQDCGLFEASRLANPVLPQYHPKQLIELLNFGKIRRVKAILAHLVRCISGNDPTQMALVGSDEHQSGHGRHFSHQRALSVAGPAMQPDSTTIPEDTNLDYIEISSIPPLPMYALFAADQDTPPSTINSEPTGSKSQVNGNFDNCIGRLFKLFTFRSPQTFS